MKVSIIVPVYNCEKYIERCVISLKNQDYDNIEIILVDDGSKDQSSSICDKLARENNNVKVFHKSNEGAYKARLFGVNKASGDYICFVDSDDWVLTDYVSYMVKLIKQYQADICCISYCISSSEKRYLNNKNRYIEVYDTESFLQQYLFQGLSRKINDFGPVCKLIKKQLFNSLPSYDFYINEDILMNFLLFEKCSKIVKSSYIGYFYCQDSSSITRQKLNLKHFDMIYVAEKLKELSTKYGDPLLRYSSYMYAKSFFSLIVKGRRYGVDSSVTINHINFLWEKFNENYYILLKSPLSLKKKIAVIYLKIYSLIKG